MYPAALHKNPTKTVDSSQVFEKRFFPKQRKITNKTTKKSDKNIIKDLEHVCRKEDHDFPSWFLSSKTILHGKKLPTWAVICIVHSISQYWISNKTLNNSERFIFVDTDNTFHNTNFTNLKNALSSYQTILPRALHSDVWSFVWISKSSKTTFLHQRDLGLWDSQDHPIFQLFIQ